MKKINYFALSFIFAGSFLGAGFVSGQELWQFFGKFGTLGIIGMAISALLFFLLGNVIFYYAKERKTDDVGILAIPWDIPFLRAFVGFIECFFMLGIFIIMIAAAGAMFSSLFPIPSAWASLIFALCVYIFAVKGITSMTRVFSFFVPLLVLFSVVLCIYSISTSTGFDLNPKTDTSANPLLSNFVISSVSYAFYNVFSSLGVMASYSSLLKSKKDTVFGILGGVLILCLVCIGILLTFFANPFVLDSELPMLEYAVNRGIAVGYIFAFLLFGAMLGTSVSVSVATTFYLEKKITIFGKYKVLFVLLITVICWLCSLFGFSDLIGTVYPIGGYIGSLVLLTICINTVRMIIKKGKNKSNEIR